VRDMAHTFTASGSTPAVNLLEKFLEAFLRISSAPWEFTHVQHTAFAEYLCSGLSAG